MTALFGMMAGLKEGCGFLRGTVHTLQLVLEAFRKTRWRKGHPWQNMLTGLLLTQGPAKPYKGPKASNSLKPTDQFSGVLLARALHLASWVTIRKKMAMVRYQ